MVEVKTEKKQLGVFDACGLQEVRMRNEIFEFVKSNLFFVLLVNDDCKHLKNHPIIKRMEQKGFCVYTGIVVTINGLGMENFKDTFHRSSSYVDQRMISYKDFKKIFEGNHDIIEFFEGIAKEMGEFQIKGIKKILLRKKVFATSKVAEN